MTALSVQRVSRRVGAVTAVDDVSFDVDAGRTVALLGPSGCGKTTLLRIIAGLERPDAGSVVIDGATVTGPGQSLRPERRNIGYVAQEGALFPHLTVAGNIEFALDRAQRRAGTRLPELLDLVSLDRVVLRRFPHELSGGQQQRVALARALARRPGLMLLDEPFAALDASLRAGTRELMAEALAAEKVTTILVTHDQEEALSFADQVVVLRDGRIRQSGTPRDVYERPADTWTAGFVGDAVFLPAQVQGGRARTPLGDVEVNEAIGAADPRTRVMLRPEQVQLTPAGETSAGVRGLVVTSSYRGPNTVVTVQLAEPTAGPVSCRLPGHLEWVAPGVEVAVSVTGHGALISDAD